MDFAYQEKPLLPTKTALDELSNIDIDLYKAIEILEQGFAVRKRKKYVIEKAIRKGNKIINIVVVDQGAYYKLIHAGEFSINKKFMKLMRENKNGF
jgi:hypothetical protein